MARARAQRQCLPHAKLDELLQLRPDFTPPDLHSEEPGKEPVPLIRRKENDRLHEAIPQAFSDGESRTSGNACIHDRCDPARVDGVDPPEVFGFADLQARASNPPRQVGTTDERDDLHQYTLS